MKNQEVFSTTGRIIIGTGKIFSVVEEIKRLNGTKVLIVTDPGLVASGVVDKLEDILKKGGVPFCRYDKVEADPRYELTEDALALLKSENADLIVGIGGGSSLDIAKVVSVLATNDQPVTELFGIELVKKPGIPLILIPTTAGTGSEVTPITILSDTHEKLKKGVVSSYLFPSCALLDPELTIGLPPKVTAASGMDALIHAVEAYTSRNATPTSDMLAKEAIKLIFANLRMAYADGENLEARGNMLRGSMLAGMAFANAGVTAVHAFAYPIGAEFHIPHGVANTIMLVPTLQFNLPGNLKRFAELADFFEQPVDGMSKREAAQAGLQAIVELAEDLRVPQHLAEFGVQEKDVPALATAVLKVTRLLANNPRKLEYADAEDIYRKAL